MRKAGCDGISSAEVSRRVQRHDHYEARNVHPGRPNRSWRRAMLAGRRCVRVTGVGAAGTAAVAAFAVVAGAVTLAVSTDLVGLRSLPVSNDPVAVNATAETTIPPLPAVPSAGATAADGDAAHAVQDWCEARLRRYQGGDDPFNVSLAAGFAQEAAEVAAEDERVHGSGFRSSFRDRSAREVVALCYFDADAFGIAPPPPGVAIPPGVHTRLQEVVTADGRPYVLRAGQKSGIPVRALEGEVR